MVYSFLYASRGRVCVGQEIYRWQCRVLIEKKIQQLSPMHCQVGQVDQVGQAGQAGQAVPSDSGPSYLFKLMKIMLV